MAVKKINIDVYGQEVLLFESYDEMRNWIKKNPIKHADEMEEIMECSSGFAGILETENDEAKWFITLEEKDVVTLCHETLHVAYMMLEAIGVKHDAENHEVLAYLQHYIFGEAGKKLKIIE